jgi:predicted dehydrogenase
MKKHKVLLLGASGLYGLTWYKEIVKLDNCELTGVCASSIESLSKLPSISGISPERYDDVETAIAECDADIALIVLPTHMHANACQLALKQGLHILCEKPVAASLTEAAELCELAKKHPKQKFMIAQNYRFRNHVRTLGTAACNLVAGEICNIMYEFRRPENLWGYRTNMDLPLLRDVSIHHFDLMRYLTGKNCAELYATAYKQPWCEFRDRASVEAIIKMEDSIIVNYTGTWSGRGIETPWDGKITIYGSKGFLALDENSVVTFTPAGGGQPQVIEPISEEMLSDQHRVLLHLTECIEEDREPETSIWDNYNSFEMQCAAEASIKENKPVGLKGIVHRVIYV